METTPSSTADYRLPFIGRWFVAQGGDTINVNHHMKVEAQWYGLDFLKVGGNSSRSVAKASGSSAEDFYSWSENVLSPTDGEIVRASDQFPDNPIGQKDAKNPTGNCVVIKASPDRFIFIAHFQRGSLTVKIGDKVSAGQILGKCGNSGNSDAPHIHMHVQENPVLNEGRGQNIVFHGINVEMNGKLFENVDWPLMRGFFVWQS